MSTESIMRSVCWPSTRVRFWEVTVARSIARSRAFQLAQPAELMRAAQAKAIASQITTTSGGLRMASADSLAEPPTDPAIRSPKSAALRHLAWWRIGPLGQLKVANLAFSSICSKCGDAWLGFLMLGRAGNAPRNPSPEPP